MAIFILIAFIAIPLVEIAVFIEVGGRIGVWYTVLTVVVTAAIGTWLLRAQGLQTLARARESLNRNIFPVSELFDGLCLLVAGALLLTPGFVTDAIGFLMFLPPVRRLLRYWGWLMLARSGNARVWVNGEDITGGGTPRGAGGRSGTIDGDFREIDDPDTKDSDKNDKLPPRRP